MRASRIVIVLLVLNLVFFAIAYAYAGCQYEYDEDGYLLGVLYTVDVYSEPYTVSCGQWTLNGLPAPSPNSDVPVSEYCRETDGSGHTFFTYRYRGLMDCALLGPNLIWKMTY